MRWLIGLALICGLCAAHRRTPLATIFPNHPPLRPCKSESTLRSIIRAIALVHGTGNTSENCRPLKYHCPRINLNLDLAGEVEEEPAFLSPLIEANKTREGIIRSLVFSLPNRENWSRAAELGAAAAGCGELFGLHHRQQILRQQPLLLVLPVPRQGSASLRPHIVSG